MDRQLVIAPAWLGDMVMAQSLFKAMQATVPGLALHVVAPKSTYPLLERMPEVQHAWLLPTVSGQLGLSVRYKLARQIAPYKVQKAIVLPNSFKSAFLPWLAGIKNRCGWLGEMRFFWLNDVRYKPSQLSLMVERFVALAYEDGTYDRSYQAPSLMINKEQQRQLQQKWQLTSSKPLVALCPGAAFGSAKRWPLRYFAKLTQQLSQQGYQVMVLGGQQEKALGHLLQVACQDVVDLTARTKLVEVIDLLALADVVVSNDSGLMHVAAAVDSPVVAIYGSTSPDFTPPLTTKRRIISQNLPCRPCFQRVCPLQHLQCMLDSTPDMVLTAVNDLYEHFAC